MIRYLKDGGRAAIVLPDGSLTGDGVKMRIRQEFLEKCNVHTIVRLPNSVFQPYASVATNLILHKRRNLIARHIGNHKIDFPLSAELHNLSP